MFAAMKSGNTASYVPAVPEPTQAPMSNGTNSQEFNGRKFRPQVKVMGIPENTNEEDLKAFFSSVAEVKGVKILPLREGKDTTMGFVDFETEAEVQKAVQEKNDVEFNGSNLRVCEGNRSGGGGGGGGGGGNRNADNNNNQNSSGKSQVKVFNIPDGTDEDELKTFFTDAGNITRIHILPCREGKDVTLGFVHFERAEEVDKAVEMFNNRDFKGSNLRVMNADGGALGGGGMFRPGRNENFLSSDERKPMGRGAQLFANVNSLNNGGVGVRRSRGPQCKVFGIPVNTNQSDVRDMFASAGNVVNVNILPLREGKDNHLGFVEFSTDAEVQAAVDQMDGMDLNGSTLKVMPANNQQTSNGYGESAPRFENNSTSWNSGPSAPTMRLPREDTGRNHHFNGDIQLDANFDMNGGMNGMMDDEMPRMAPVTYIPPPPPETEDEIFQQPNHEGINFNKYENIPVKITGNEPIAPITDFKDAKLHMVCNKNIMRAKYHTPTPVQKYALPAVLARRDLMACAQTGSGKTASFLLPVITNILNEGLPSSATFMGGPVYPLALVVAPTRELATQIFHEARKFSFESELRSVVLYGGVSVGHQTDILQRGCHICIATPGRLEDFVKRGKLSFKNLKFMIFDEADRMLDMGFGSQINAIINNSEMPPKSERTTLMFSATFPDEIQQMASTFLHDYLFLTVGRVGGACADVQQTILQVKGSEKRDKLEEILHQSGTDRTLVFVERKKDADFLATFLSQRNYPATSLNGDRSQQEREAALLDFRKGNAPVLVATAVAGRGLDIDDVKHVVNYDLPKEATEYVHRIGRTGRIGNKGKATSFFDERRDQDLARPIVRMLSEADQNVPDWLERIALEAVGTGYGQDKSSFHDRRGGVRSAGGGYGGVTNGMRSPPSSTQTSATLANDDEEEW